MSEDIVNVETPEDLTPEMIAAGVRAWEESAGDEYPKNSITNGPTVADIYRAMREAAIPAG